MTRYRITVIAGKRWTYYIRAHCPLDAIKHVMARNRNANWITTFCEAC